MFNLEKITVLEYLRLDAENLNNYNNLQRVMNSKDVFCGKN